MARQIHEQIEVVLDADRAAPVAFLRGDRRYRVCHVDACWKQVGAWWNGDGERTVFRLTAVLSVLSPRLSVEGRRSHILTESGGRRAESLEEGIYELVHDHATGRWFLAGILD